MSFPKVNPTQTQAWKSLSTHFQEVKYLKMQDLFTENPKRAQQFSLQWKDFYIDYSKNRITQTTLNQLLQLAEEVQLKDAMEAQFTGEHINETEDRAVGKTSI